MDDETPDETPDETSDETPAPRALRWTAVVLAALLVALLATSAWLWRTGPDAPDGDADAAGALTTGRQAASLFFSLDPTAAGASVDALLDLSTGGFRTDYAAERDALVEQVTSQGLTVTAVVPDDGLALEHLDGDAAQVLVAVDTDTRLRDGRQERDNYRIRVQLRFLDGEGWRVSGLEQVG